jgi:predicted DNA-binding antitoxin AbrB/MazE fold protein
MAVYPNLPARYSKGTLKLRRRLRLPDGAEVRVSVTLASPNRTRRSAKRAYVHPNRSFPLSSLAHVAGIASLGGDALADTEALYDEL